MTNAVDYVPVLQHLPKWLPGMGFKRQAAVWRKPTLDMAAAPFAEVKRAMVGVTHRYKYAQFRRL